MILSKYGISLRSINENDLELIRNMRNSNAIRKKMIFQKTISTEEQINWYKSLDRGSDFYFMIEIGEKKYGLINVKKINHKDLSSESGLFIWNEDAINSHIPVLASWLISETGYGILNGPGCNIRVLKSNASAIGFNKKMGFCTIKEDDEVVYLYQSKDSFSKTTKDKRDLFLKGIKKDHSINIYFGDHENDSFYRETIEELAKKNTIELENLSREHFRIQIHF
jgi:hypothetical protein